MLASGTDFANDALSHYDGSGSVCAFCNQQDSVSSSALPSPMKD